VSRRNAALAAMIGPAVFVLVLVVLTLMQYDFMVETGWPWPSGLALGTLGWLQVLNFVFFGLTMIAFAVGLHRSVAVGGRMSWVGPILFIVAGVAMVLLGFKVDNPSFTPQTWHGWIHGLSFFLFLYALIPAFFFLGWRMRKDSLWRGYDLYTLITGVLYVVVSIFFLGTQWGIFLLVAVIVVWMEITATRLRSLAAGVG
jgi:Protein of unknown function (DUF998)